MPVASASAPGKLILLGEYAVLEGAPAVVLAVDRRARVRITAGADHNVLDAPEITTTAVPFSVDPSGNVSWFGVDPATTARLGVIEQVLTRFPPGEPVRIETDTAEFHEDGIKVGLGSSAALTVAAAAALSGRRPELATVVAVHRAAQGGRGSGFDVAASLHGGAIVYRAEPLEVLPLSLPPGLQLRGIWTGHAASTTGFLRGLAALGPRRAALTPLTEAAEAAVASLGQDAASWVGAVRDYAGALAAFARSTSLPILSGGHRELMALAADYNVVYKPSGAGGGDLGIAVSDDEEALAAFVSALPPAPVGLLRLGIDGRGLALS